MQWIEHKNLFSNPEINYPNNKNFSIIFEEVVRNFGEKIAVQTESKQYTYSELNKKANQLAHFLQKQGVEPNSIIAISMDRSIEMVIAILAIVKAGGAYMPINSNEAINRALFMIKESNPLAIIVNTKVYNVLCYGDDTNENIISKLLNIDDFLMNVHNDNIENPNCKSAGDDLLNVIYTSGSSGSPKACLISQKNVLRVVYKPKYIKINTSDIIAQITNIAFDILSFEIWGTLLNGASLFIVPSHVLLCPTEFTNFLTENKISILVITASLLNSIVKKRPDAFDHLNYLLFGGEKANSEIIKILLKRKQSLQLSHLNIVNAYGPTECSVFSLTFSINSMADINGSIPIGVPISNTHVYVLDSELKFVPANFIGELYIGGGGLASGYLNSPIETARNFIPAPWNPDEIIYKTGDFVYWLPTVGIIFVERMDTQLKINGFRIDLTEIESVILRNPHIYQTAVITEKNDNNNNSKIIAYVCFYDSLSADLKMHKSQFIRYLRDSLPNYMFPNEIIQVNTIPLTPNGKLDKNALLTLPGQDISNDINDCHLNPNNHIEKIIVSAWQAVFKITEINITKNFFEIGGNSLLLHEVVSLINDKFNHSGYNISIQVLDMMKHSSISLLTEHISKKIKNKVEKNITNIYDDSHSSDIAIIGLSCRFPGANNPLEFWNNIVNNVESISTFTDTELIMNGVHDSELENPNYIKAKGILDNIEYFDADFFDFNVPDAKWTDPQHKIFLECVWEALETAGYPSEQYCGPIGVYSAASDSTYLHSVLSEAGIIKPANWMQTRIATSIGTLSSLVSYKLNLTGPSIGLSSACSSSLVCIITACKALVDNDCEIAVAGASAISVPQIQGYLYQEGDIYSKDGHCKPFDLDATGTVFSNGIGVVVLKRKQDAIRDGDTIYGVIKGWGINNDGREKVSFTAPSIQGQAQCISLALSRADIKPETISYIEAHGTATALGDAVEIAALNTVFNQNCDNINRNQKKYCALGSVKSNIGHTDITAGMAGFLKTVLMLNHKIIPATLHYKKPNRNFSFETSPFYINNANIPWDSSTNPRRAGVNASGIGGTNAFIIVEEHIPPLISANTQCNEPENHLLVISGKTSNALYKSIENLIEFFEKGLNDSKLSDVAYTLQFGRVPFEQRKTIVCKNVSDALLKLQRLLKDRETQQRNNALITSDINDFQNINVLSILPGPDLRQSDPEKFLGTLGHLWENGAKIDWNDIKKKKKCQRISLPTYPFERSKYWFEPSELKNVASNSKNNLKKCFYEPAWLRRYLPNNSDDEIMKNLLTRQNCWIVFLDDLGVGDAICDLLSKNKQFIIKVKNGNEFLKVNENKYLINIYKKSDYQKLVEQILLSTTPPYTVINLLPLTKEHRRMDEQHSNANITLHLSFYSNIYLIQTLFEKQDHSSKILIVGNEICAVTEEDNVYPAKSSALGLCRSIVLDYPKLEIIVMDFLLSDILDKNLFQTYARTIIEHPNFGSQSFNTNIIVFRKLFYWEQVFHPIFSNHNSSKSSFKEGGTYLITGGLGGIGLSIALSMAEKVNDLHFYLISHGPFPKRNAWNNFLHDGNNALKSVIVRLLKLEEMCAKISIIQIDLANTDAVNKAINSILNERKINGIIHAAGTSGAGITQEINFENSSKVFSPKLVGTYNLLNALNDCSLDFFFCCSSLSSITGIFGQSDYSAANASLNAFSSIKVYSNKKIISLNWNTWTQIGMAADSNNPNICFLSISQNAITPEEGVEMFLAFMQSGYKQAILSKVPIEELLALPQKSSITHELSENNKRLLQNPSPSFPNNEIEVKLVDVFEKTLDLKGVSVLHNFDDLGIHSLMTLRLLSNIEKAFMIKIHLCELQESKNIRILAKKLKNKI